jgi:hypothetical protein
MLPPANFLGILMQMGLTEITAEHDSWMVDNVFTAMTN